MKLRMKGFAHIAGRLKDRDRIPRSFWWPYRQVGKGDEDTIRIHTECSRTINRMFLAIVAFSMFCVVTLSGSEEGLLGVGTEISLPFAGVSMTVKNFVIVGPLILVGLTAYLHLYVGEWAKWHPHVLLPKRAANFFNFEGFFAKLFTNVAFYWLTPAVLCFFFWKALPLPMAFQVLSIVVATATIMIWLSIRRCNGDLRLNWNAPKWFFLFILFAFYTSAWISEIPWSRVLYLEGSNLEGKDLVEFNLRGANLAKANLKNAKLVGAILSDANLSRTTLDLADLSFADLQGATLEKASGKGAIFSGAKMMRVMAKGADLENCNLSETDLSDTNLDSANLSKCNLHKAILGRTSLAYSDLRGANLQGARLLSAGLYGTKLADANLTSAIFESVDLRGANQITAEQIETICMLGTTRFRESITLKGDRKDVCPPPTPKNFSVR